MPEAAASCITGDLMACCNPSHQSSFANLIRGARGLTTGLLQVFQALAVSNSKLGDLHYTYGHLEPALGCYQAAVQIRQQAASNPLTQDTVQQVSVVLPFDLA